MSRKLKLVIFITILFITVCSIYSFTTFKSDKAYSDSSIIMNKQEEKIVEIVEDPTNEDQETKESKVVEVKQEIKEVETTKKTKDTNSKEVSNNKTTTPKKSDSVVTTPKTETTTNNNSPSANNNNNNNTTTENNTTQSTTTTNKTSYIGVPNPNDFYYSYHKGKIDYKVSDYPNQDVMQVCINDAIEISLKDTVDILNTNCIDVMDGAGNLLGEFLYIKCSSGNCNRYKN